MDVLSLRIELETLLVDDLGVYTLANGATTPAISVRSSGESMPPGTKVRGLECVIQRDPELQPVVQYRQEQAFSVWTVFLVQWTGSASSLQDVASRVIYNYPGATATAIAVPQSVGPQHQMRLRISTDPEKVA